MFTWEKLRKYLIDDENDPASSNDFGKNVIPAMHSAGERLFAYAFDGYWKDVGTIDSLWEANLDLLNKKANIDLSDPSWKIYGRGTISAPQYISDSAKVENSIVAEGCEIEGDIDYSVLFSDVTVEEGASVKYSIVMPGAVIKKGAVVQYAMVAENSVIEEGAMVGENPEKCENLDDWGVSVVGANIKVGEGAVIKAKSMISEDVERGALV